MLSFLNRIFKKCIEDEEVIEVTPKEQSIKDEVEEIKPPVKKIEYFFTIDLNYYLFPIIEVIKNNTISTLKKRSSN